MTQEDLDRVSKALQKLSRDEAKAFFLLGQLSKSFEGTRENKSPKFPPGGIVTSSLAKEWGEYHLRPSDGFKMPLPANNDSADYREAVMSLWLITVDPDGRPKSEWILMPVPSKEIQHDEHEKIVSEYCDKCFGAGNWKKERWLGWQV